MKVIDISGWIPLLTQVATQMCIRDRKGKELIVAVGDTHEDNIRIKIQNLIVTNDDGYDLSLIHI